MTHEAAAGAGAVIGLLLAASVDMTVAPAAYHHAAMVVMAWLLAGGCALGGGVFGLCVMAIADVDRKVGKAAGRLPERKKAR